LALFAVVGVAAVTGYLFGWSWGMPFLEQPTILKIGIVIVALLFLYNIFMTMMKTRKWTVIWAVGCAIMHFFGAGVWGFTIPFPR
jgi:nitric oxide reductase large subunit